MRPMRRRLVAALCALWAAGCGDNQPGEESGFRILRVTPANGSVEVDVDSAVVVELSEPVDPDSVDGESIALTGVAASIEVAGALITLTPHDRLPFDSQLELTVTTAIASAAGEPLRASLTSRFETRWRAWSEPDVIGPASDQTGVSLFRPLVVGTAAGDAVAVWEDDAAGAYRLSGARFAAADRSWSEDAEIASGGAEYTLGPQLASDAAGNVLLVWRSVERIEHAWYNAENSAWYHGPPVHIGEQVVSVPLVALSPGGKGAALWSENGERMIARLDGDVWSPAETLGAGEAEGAALAADDGGLVTIVWRDGDTLSAQQSDGTGWGEAAPLWTDAEGARADRPRVAALPGGGAIAVWGVALADGAEVRASFFDPDLDAWSDDQVIGTAGTPADTLPELAVTAGGDVLVVWDDWNGGLDARWWRGGAWEDVVSLAGSDVFAPEHQVALDPDGNAITAYGTVSAATWWADRDWSSAEVAANAVTIPIAVTFAGADPLAVWEHYDYDDALGAPLQHGVRASFFR